MTLQRDGFALPPGGSLENLDMRGGSVLSLRLTAEQTAGRLTVIEGVIAEGGPPLHVHDDEDEVVVVLEGRLDYQVGTARGAVEAGGLLWFPRAVPHAVANHSGLPCRFLTVVTPAGIEDFFRAQRDYLATLAVAAEPDPAAMASLAGSQTRRVVGPPLTASA